MSLRTNTDAELFKSCFSGNTSKVKMLLAAGANVNGELSPLHTAGDRGHFEVVRVLLDAGADIDAVKPGLV